MSVPLFDRVCCRMLLALSGILHRISCRLEYWRMKIVAQHVRAFMMGMLTEKERETAVPLINYHNYEGLASTIVEVFIDADDKRIRELGDKFSDLPFDLIVWAPGFFRSAKETPPF